MLSKVLKYPAIIDYRRCIQELDSKQFVSLRFMLSENRNHYCTMADLINKNMEKIRKPRSSNHAPMYWTLQRDYCRYSFQIKLNDKSNSSQFLLEFFNEVNSSFMFRIDSGERACSIVTIVIIFDFVDSIKTAFQAYLDKYGNNVVYNHMFYLVNKWISWNDFEKLALLLFGHFYCFIHQTTCYSSTLSG